VQVWLEQNDEGVTFLRMGYAIYVRAPDTKDRNPQDWWNIEAITAIAASRIASSWKGESVNEPLDDTVSLLATELSEYADDAFASVTVMRSTVVRARFVRGWNPVTGMSDLLPCLFVGRAELVVQRVRALLEDVYGGALFTMAGDAKIVGAIMRMVRGRIEYDKIETPEIAQSILLRAIRFAKPGVIPKGQDAPRIVPPVGSNPPKIVCQDLIAMPPEWPPLDSIIRMPTLRSDGAVILTPGYDPESRLWMAPDPEFSSIRVPEFPVWDDVEKARQVLWKGFAQFPWVDGPGGLMAAIFEQFVIRLLGEANRPIYAIDAPPHGQGSGKCVAKGTLVSTSLGLVPIESLAQYANEISSPDEHGGRFGKLNHSRSEWCNDDWIATGSPIMVESHDGKSHAASHFYFGGVKPVRKVTLRRGATVTGTMKHPVLVATFRGPQWVKLADVKKGDYVAQFVARATGALESSISADCGWMLGTLTARKARLVDKGLLFRMMDEDVTANVIASLKQHLCINAKLVGRRLLLPQVPDLELYDLPTKDEHVERIPRTVMQSSSHVWAAYIRGLFDNMAYFGKQSIELHLDSYEFAHQVHTMMLELGVWCSLVNRTSRYHGIVRQFYQITVTGEDLDVFAVNIGLSNRDKTRKLYRLIGRPRSTHIDVVPKMGYMLGKVVNSGPEYDEWSPHVRGLSMPPRNKLACFVVDKRAALGKSMTKDQSNALDVLEAMSLPHIRWSKVVSIEDGDDAVFDLTVPETHSFVANGIIVHNTFTAQMVGIIITGETPPGGSKGGSTTDEELEKRITAFLRIPTNYHMIDNITHVMSSDGLAILATSPKWRARILGETNSPDMPNRATWMLTLNGGKFSKDLVRRVVLIRYDAGTLNAYERGNFDIPYPLEWTKENRPQIVEAILTIARAWHCAGRPADKSLRGIRGGFEKWMDIVGSIVSYAGFRGLPASLQSTKDREAETEDDDTFLTLWENKYGYAELQAKTLVDLARGSGLYEELFKRYPRQEQNQWLSRAFAKEILDRFALRGVVIAQGPKGNRLFALKPNDPR